MYEVEESWKDDTHLFPNNYNMALSKQEKTQKENNTEGPNHCFWVYTYNIDDDICLEGKCVKNSCNRGDN